MAIEEIEIEGYLGKNPTSPSDKFPDMLTFSVGVTQVHKTKDSDIKESRTTWYDVICFDKNRTAYLKHKLVKGDKVIVKGRPSIKTWVGKDNVTNSIISITLTQIALMKKENDGNYENNHSTFTADSKFMPRLNTEILDDDIPF